MEEKQIEVSRISWQDIFPALLVFRALPAAMSFTILVIALLGAVITPVGWIVLDTVLVSENMTAEDPGLARATEINRSPWKAVYPAWHEGQSLVTVLGQQLRGVELVFKSMVDSVRGVFSLHPGFRRFLYFLGGSIWTLLVWSFAGCAICRTALMRYTRDDPIGIDDAFAFAVDKFRSCFAGIAIPLLAVFGLAIPVALIGLLMASDVGAVVGGALWFLVLIPSLMMSVILLGLMFAWPLIVAAISCEGQDSLEGMSRGFSYVFQRPVHCFAYALIGVVFSGVCWIVASMLIEGTIQTAWWATSWGSNIVNYRTGELSGNSPVSIGQLDGLARQDLAAGNDLNVNPTGQADVQADSASGSLGLAQRLVGFWNALARTFGAAFLYGLFWCIASAIYLLLRKDLDNTETDEIHLVDQERTFELPPLQESASGVPQVAEDSGNPAEGTSTDSGLASE